MKKTTNKIINISSLIFLGLLLVFVSVISCYKDDDPQQEIINESVELRNGQGDIVFYRGSLTTDNYLVRNTNNTVPPREYSAYNHNQVDQIVFTSTGTGLANIAGVLCNHYEAIITFKDRTTERITCYTKNSGNSFTFKPTSSSLGSLNTCNKVVWIDFGSPKEYYNEFLGVKSSLNMWGVYCGSTRVALKQKEPLNKNSKIFQLPGVH